MNLERDRRPGYRREALDRLLLSYLADDWEAEPEALPTSPAYLPARPDPTALPLLRLRLALHHAGRVGRG